jgi:hypothetical protein
VSGLQRYSGWDWTSVVLSGSSTANALFSPNAVKVAFRGNGICVTNLALVLRVQYSAGVAPHSPYEAARQPLAAWLAGCAGRQHWRHAVESGSSQIISTRRRGAAIASGAG